MTKFSYKNKIKKPKKNVNQNVARDPKMKGKETEKKKNKFIRVR